MKVYARVLESSSMARVVANYAKVVTRDVRDRPTSVACWNHPEYVGFWADTMEDLFRSYDLDGIQWGAERQGPLMNVISPWDNNPPTCFCEHCRRRGAAAGIDPERARLGFETLHMYVQGQIAKQPRPADGMFVGFLRILLRYPEILAWEMQYRLGREPICDAMYRAVKAVKPTAEVGWHVDHQPSSWDLVYRAEMSYEEMAPHADFIKFIGYHNVLSPRIRDWYLPRFQRTILGELSLGSSLDSITSSSATTSGPSRRWPSLAAKGSACYVYRETRHSVASANGKTKIYTGIGFDVPGAPPDDPDTIYQATVKAFEANADGIVVSREDRGNETGQPARRWTRVSRRHEDARLRHRRTLKAMAGLAATGRPSKRLFTSQNPEEVPYREVELQLRETHGEAPFRPESGGEILMAPTLEGNVAVRIPSGYAHGTGTAAYCCFDCRVFSISALSCWSSCSSAASRAFSAWISASCSVSRLVSSLTPPSATTPMRS